MMEKETNRSLEETEIGAVDISEAGEALNVLVRGMRDNPLHVAVFGEDPNLREKRLRRLFGGAFDILGWHENMLAARSAEGAIVGVMGMAPPGKCQPSASQQLRILPLTLANGPRAAGRAMGWLGAWAKRDPGERHVHFGPLAVDAHIQGRGIGSKLLRVFAAKMDAAGEDAYLETDKPINVKLYERFGFEVVGEGEVLGVPNWFMLRRAERRR